MGKDLFDDGSDNETEEIQLNTNKEYAKTYNKFRQKELLKKLKDRDGDTSGSDSSSESDYSEEELVNNLKFDQEFLKTLSSLKSKDPKIYDKNIKFFDDVDIEIGSKSKSDSKKPFTLKDHERKVILERNGMYEDDEFNESMNEGRPLSPSYAEEQKRLREEFRKAIDSDNESEDEFGGIFKKREKTNEEKKKEEEEYLQWLAGKKEDIAEEAKETLKPLKQYWNKDDLPKQEKFLRDYILNNGYIDKENDEVPTYDEIVGNENLSEDEKELEKQEEFEQKYNFRFEEPDKEFIKRYPRTIDNSVRKKDDKRKRKREEIKERKLKEKEEKYKEIEMLKALKKKEIEEKIQKLKEVTGNDELPFHDEDFEEEFDPAAHDRRMKEIFNDEYYQVDEGDEKPECPDIEDLKTEDWDNFDPQNDEEDERYVYEPHCEDDDFNMDCDYDPNKKQDLQSELIENTKDKRKRRKRRNRFMEMIKTEKPPFNPEDEKTYSQYIDEYYKMDCEDIIGDLPCRFKYVETVPNDFGLTIEEILLAKTKELNQWASLKKAVQIRPEQDEKRDVKLFKLKAKNEALKRKIFVSLYGPPSEDEDEQKYEKCKPEIEDSNKDVNNKKKRKKKKGNTSHEILVDNNTKSNTTEDEPAKEWKTYQENGLQANLNQNKEDKSINNSVEEVNCQKNHISEKPKKKKKKNKNLHKDTKDGGKGKIRRIDKTSTKKFKGKNGSGNKFSEKSSTEISDERLKAYGINPRKFHKKQKYLKFMKNKNHVKSKAN